MSKCIEYQELISAYADGELSAPEMLRLEEHLRECADCSSILDAYREISHAMDDSLVQAPQSLLIGVMDRVNHESAAQSVLQASASKKKPPRTKIILSRYVPLAACLAILLLTVPRLFGFGGPFNSTSYDSSAPAPGMLNPNTASGGDGGSSGGSGGNAMPEASAGGGSGDGGYVGSDADQSGTAEGSRDDEWFSVDGDTPKPVTDSVHGNEPMTVPQESNNSTERDVNAAPDPADPASPEMPLPPVDTPGGAQEGGKHESQTGEPTTDDGMPSGMATDTGGGGSSKAGADTDIFLQGIYAIITITGEFPSLLMEYEPIDKTLQGEVIFEIPRTELEALISELTDYVWNPSDESAEYIRVIYIPTD